MSVKTATQRKPEQKVTITKEVQPKTWVKKVNVILDAMRDFESDVFAAPLDGNDGTHRTNILQAINEFRSSLTNLWADKKAVEDFMQDSKDIANIVRETFKNIKVVEIKPEEKTCPHKEHK